MSSPGSLTEDGVPTRVYEYVDSPESMNGGNGYDQMYDGVGSSRNNNTNNDHNNDDDQSINISFNEDAYGEPENEENNENEYNEENDGNPNDDNEMDDNEELVEMRGGGRYFGTGEEDLGPICRNCHGRGHMARNCPVVICEVCGVVDDHYSRQCPSARKCSNCGQPGHLRSECKNKSKYIFCSKCESRAHTEQFCPLIWRSYRTVKNKPIYPSQISCYDCGKQGHYGDECPTSRVANLRFIERTAFSGENLARPLRPRYRVDSKKPERPDWRTINMDFDDYDYDYDRDYRSFSNQNNKSRSQSRFSSFGQKFDKMKSKFKDNRPFDKERKKKRRERKRERSRQEKKSRD